MKEIVRRVSPRSTRSELTATLVVDTAALVALTVLVLLAWHQRGRGYVGHSGLLANLAVAAAPGLCGAGLALLTVARAGTGRGGGAPVRTFALAWALVVLQVLLGSFFWQSITMGSSASTCDESPAQPGLYAVALVLGMAGVALAVRMRARAVRASRDRLTGRLALAAGVAGAAVVAAGAAAFAVVVTVLVSPACPQ